MPATEKTWRDQKLLHVIFGFSSIVMLLSTVWMFAVDHDREWKGYQRKFRDAEQQLTQWRMDEQLSVAHRTESDDIEEELFAAQLTPPSEALYLAFKSEVDAEADRLEQPQFDFTRLDEQHAALTAPSAVALESFGTLATAREGAAVALKAVADAQKALNEAEGAGRDAKHAAKQTLKEATAAHKALDKEANQLADSLEQTVRDVLKDRNAFLRGLSRLIDKARGREDDLLSRRKFESADFDKAKADQDILVRDGASDAAMTAAQDVINKIKSQPGGLDDLTLQREAATAHREKLQQIDADMRAEETALDTRLIESQAEYDRLIGSFNERRVTFFTGSFPFLGKRWLELPILDAFNSPLTIDNHWTEGLMIPQGSFGEVRRFDRCTTCHRGIDKTAAGSSVDPAYVQDIQIDLIVETPQAAPTPADPNNGLTLEEVYGIRLADKGLIDPNDVTVSHVTPRSVAANAPAIVEEGHPAASPGFEVGDVLRLVNGDKVLEPVDARQYMLDGATWGEPLTVTVRRGLPQPYTSHPRLDLFVGSMSPHKLSTFACTSCHEGQGSATSFEFASHTPNSIEQAKEWAREYGWFNNHHWIYPMFPKRFAESACIRCHHQVTELESSQKFLEPPAPKVVRGYQLMLDYGCYGCHEISGYDGPDRRIGPDLRVEPPYSAAAATVKADPDFSDLDPRVQSWVTTLIEEPYRDQVRHKLSEFLAADAHREPPELGARALEMVDALKDQETPGTLRRAGPSLRYVKDKLGAEFMNDWIRKPSHFRANTKMPQFFGLWDHLDAPGRQAAKDYEPVEIQSITAYLLKQSEPFQFTAADQDAEPGSAERGKIAFEIRGCLACHMHEDFPEITANQGPDLSGIGDKLSAKAGSPHPAEWLYTWLKNPSNYHARTKMPDLQLTPQQNPEGAWIDPAADITAFLLSDSHGWSPDPAANVPFDPQALNRLCLDYLSAAFPRRDAENYLQNGIPNDVASSLKGAEVELVVDQKTNQKLTDADKVQYIGRKSIAKYGCFGCHDIPGFEMEKPIGTALADWGRKESSKLAFEHIVEYLHQGHGGDDAGGHRGGQERGQDGEHETADATHNAEAPGNESLSSQHETDDGTAVDSAASIAFFESQIGAQDRSGFIWQKLREPRSYDFKKTANKRYNERLKMPLFPLNADEREAVITFVLGLVAAPPSVQFVYEPTPRRKAITEGMAVLEKYNCAGCHVLRPEIWSVEFASDEITAPENPPDFPFLAIDASAAEIAASNRRDLVRGLFSAHLVGMPALSNDDASVEVWDEDWEPIDPEELDEYGVEELVYPIQLWKPAVVEGKVFDIGARVAVPALAIKQRISSDGGDLAKYLLRRVTAIEKQSNPNANGTESWSWVPPPLVGEGSKVQPDWLHNFLLDPYQIRPAVFLRMPKFNMSPDEATKLVNYFAAVEDVDYPFEFDPRLRPNHLADVEATFAGSSPSESRLDHAMKIVTNGNYCVKCHLVGDFVPDGNVRALAPDLALSQNRLRPDFMRRWIANPLKVLPYTPMPVNITYNPADPHLGGVAQKIFPGTSIEQLDGVVDLLTHFGEYLSQKSRIADMVQPVAPDPAKEVAENDD